MEVAAAAAVVLGVGVGVVVVVIVVVVAVAVAVAAVAVVVVVVPIVLVVVAVVVVPIRSNCSKNTRRLNLVKNSFLHFLHSTKFSRQRLNFPTGFTFRLNLLGRLNVDLVGRVFF